MRQAKKADVLPGQWHIPAGTVLKLAIGTMMRYDNNLHQHHHYYSRICDSVSLPAILAVCNVI